MLVLSRKLYEEVHIGDNIVISVQKIAGDKIRLGIVAPLELQVLRGELVGKLMQALAPEDNEEKTA